MTQPRNNSGLTAAQMGALRAKMEMQKLEKRIAEAERTDYLQRLAGVRSEPMRLHPTKTARHMQPA